MKNRILNLVIATAIAFLSLPSQAQKISGDAKPPKVSGPVLQEPTGENKAIVPATVTDKDLHQTATKKSSFTDPIPVKGNEHVQPPKPAERQLPQTNLIQPPSHPEKKGS